MPPMVLPSVITEQVAGWLSEPVWTISKSDISLDTAVNGKVSVRPSAHRLVTAPTIPFPTPRVKK
jgi:hypothetical protein